MVRSPDARNGYLVDLRADGGVNVWRQVDGAFDLLRHGDAVPGFDPAADHDLGVALRGDEIVPSLDGTALPAVTDGTFAQRPRRRARGLRPALELGPPGGDGRRTARRLYEDGLRRRETPSPPSTMPRSADRLVAVAARPAEGAGASDPARIVDLTELAAERAPVGRSARPLADRRLHGPRARGHQPGIVPAQLPRPARRRGGRPLPRRRARRVLPPLPVGVRHRRCAASRTTSRSSPRPTPTSAAVPWSPSMEGELARGGRQPGDARCRPSTTTSAATAGACAARSGAGSRTASPRRTTSARAAGWIDTASASSPTRCGTSTGRRSRSAAPATSTRSTSGRRCPGTDLVFDHFQLGYHRTLSRWPASTSHQLGLERTYLESMGAMGWGVTPALTRQVLGGFAARGVNFTLLHATYTDPGFIPYPPPFQPLQPVVGEVAPAQRVDRPRDGGRAGREARAETALMQPQRAAEAWQDTPQGGRDRRGVHRRRACAGGPPGRLRPARRGRARRRPRAAGARAAARRPPGRRAAGLPRSPCCPRRRRSRSARCGRCSASRAAAARWSPSERCPTEEAGGDDDDLRRALRRAVQRPAGGPRRRRRAGGRRGRGRGRRRGDIAPGGGGRPGAAARARPRPVVHRGQRGRPGRSRRPRPSPRPARPSCGIPRPADGRGRRVA